MFTDFDYAEKIFCKYLDLPNRKDYEQLEMEAMNSQSPSAYYFMGYILYYGIGVERNISLASVYLEEAIKFSGSISPYEKRIYKSFELMAWICESGDLGKEYYEKAILLYKEAIKGDNAYFSYERLGFLFYWGKGCECDYIKAFNYFNIASEGKRGLSYYYIGVMYRDAIGIEGNIEKAIENFSYAADEGNEDAMSCLGYMYSKYYNSWKTDVSLSINYYLQLTKLDSERAQRMGWYGMGLTYLESENINDKELALEYLDRAAELGSVQAMDLLNSILR